MRKNLFLSLVILSVFAFFTQNSVVAQTGCTTPACYGNSCNCTSWSAWTIKTEYIIIPSFPTCSLAVDICYRQCLSDPTCVEMYMHEWSGFSLCGGCNDLVKYLQGISSWELARRLKSISNEIISTVALKWYNQFVTDLQAVGMEPNWCDEQDYRYKFSYYSGSCRAFCYTQFPTSDPTKALLVVPKDCAEEFCCQRKIIFCTNRDGSIYMTEELTAIPSTYQCQNYTYPLGLCEPGQNVIVSDCIDTCNE